VSACLRAGMHNRQVANRIDELEAGCHRFSRYLVLDFSPLLRSLIKRTKEFSIMIIETKVYSCRKCQSEELVKNGTNASGSSQYHCKACGAYGVLDRTERASDGRDELWSFFFATKEKGPQLIHIQHRNLLALKRF